MSSINSNQAQEPEFMHSLLNRPHTEEGSLHDQASPSKYLNTFGMRNVGMPSLNTKLGSESNLMAFEVICHLS